MRILAEDGLGGLAQDKVASEQAHRCVLDDIHNTSNNL